MSEIPMWYVHAFRLSRGMALSGLFMLPFDQVISLALLATAWAIDGALCAYAYFDDSEDE